MTALARAARGGRRAPSATLLLEAVCCLFYAVFAATDSDRHIFIADQLLPRVINDNSN